MPSNTTPVILITLRKDGRAEYRAKVVYDVESLFNRAGEAVKQRVHKYFGDVFPVILSQDADGVLAADVERFRLREIAIEFPKRVIDLRGSGDFTFPNAHNS